MSSQKSGQFRRWVLGAAATGLLWPSMPATAESKVAIFPARKRTEPKIAPAQTTEPPRLLAVPDNAKPAPKNVVPVSQMEVAASGKSEVQKQLEALYEQDGREMPNMNINLQPISPNGGQSQPAALPMATPPKSANRPTQGYTQYQPRTQATPYPYQPAAQQQPRNFSSAIDAQQSAQAQPQQQPRKNPITGFFKKFSGGNKQPTNQAPIPPDFSNGPPVASVPSIPPVMTSKPAQSTAKYAAPAQPVVQSARPAYKPVQVTSTTNGVAKTPKSNAQTSSNAQISIGAVVQQELPQPALAIPPLSQQPIPIKGTSNAVVSAGIPDHLPPLMTEPLPPNGMAKSVSNSPKPENASSEESLDFPNPFPDQPETIADRKFVAPVSPNKQESPKSTAPVKTATSPLVIALPNEQALANAPATALVTAEPAKDVIVETDRNEETSLKMEDDPFAVEAKDFSEPMIAETSPPSVKAEVSAEADTQIFVAPRIVNSPGSIAAPELVSAPANQTDDLPVSPVTNEPIAPAPLANLAPPDQSSTPSVKKTEEPKPPELTAPSIQDLKPAVESAPLEAPLTANNGAVIAPEKEVASHLEKMRRIRERFGMKGLKGFCPVSLYDDRELVDARPEFQATYRSQKFHFASAAARDKFESDPHRYAPAAYGADVVALSRDKDVVEGTLDFAAWFKGRLYLFGTQGNYEVFIATPAKFASLAGVE